jgi:hypothetical protein
MSWHRANKAQLEQHGIATAVVPLGCASNLDGRSMLPEDERDIDVLFFGVCADRDGR